MNIKRLGNVTQNFQPLEGNTRPSTADTFADTLVSLQAGIDRSRRYWDTFDVYKFVDKISNEGEFDSKVNSLLANQSLVVNSDAFIKDGQFFKRGDVILKDNDGELFLIPSKNGGVYIPKLTKNKDNGNCKLTYSYSNGESGNVDETTITPSDTNPPVYYGESHSIDDFKKGIKTPTEGPALRFDVIQKSSKNVLPIVKFFSNRGEEVCVDYFVVISKNTDKDEWGQIVLPGYIVISEETKAILSALEGTVTLK